MGEGNFVKVCDFGLARFKSDLNTGSMQFSGTPTYMAPEQFLKKSYSEKVDVFAFGALLWELATRQVPYDGLEPHHIKEKVCEEEPLKMPYGSDKKLMGLINSCRSLDEDQRPSFESIVKTLETISSSSKSSSLY